MRLSSFAVRGAPYAIWSCGRPCGGRVCVCVCKHRTALRQLCVQCPHSGAFTQACTHASAPPILLHTCLTLPCIRITRHYFMCQSPNRLPMRTHAPLPSGFHLTEAALLMPHSLSQASPPAQPFQGTSRQSILHHLLLTGYWGHPAAQARCLGCWLGVLCCDCLWWWLHTVVILVGAGPFVPPMVEPVAAAEGIAK